MPSKHLHPAGVTLDIIETYLIVSSRIQAPISLTKVLYHSDFSSECLKGVRHILVE
jgi:hypothetical protein